MLAYILAFAVGLGSLALYTAALFFPEVYRKGDFIWSGVGLFYALVLWVCAGQIRGGLLLGQTASVALIGWLGWQTLTMRRNLTPTSQQTKVSEDLPAKLVDSFKQLPQKVTGVFKRSTPATKSPTMPPVTAQSVASPVATPEEITPSALETPEPQVEIVEIKEVTSEAPSETAPSATGDAPSTPEVVETPEIPEPSATTPTEVKTPPSVIKQPQSKSFAQIGRVLVFLQNRLKKKPKTKPTAKSTPTPAATTPVQPTVDDDFDFDDLEEATPAETPENTPTIEVQAVDSAEAPTVPDVENPVSLEKITPETEMLTSDPDEASSEEKTPISETETLHRPNPPDPELVEAAQAEDPAESDAQREENLPSESSETPEEKPKET